MKGLLTAAGLFPHPPIMVPEIGGEGNEENPADDGRGPEIHEAHHGDGSGDGRRHVSA